MHNNTKNIFFNNPPDVKISAVIKRGRNIKKKSEKQSILEDTNIYNQIWLTMSEAAKIAGVNNKTIRRAVLAKKIRYKVAGNRYLIDLASLIKYIISKKKLVNKFMLYGLGQYVEKWKE